MLLVLQRNNFTNLSAKDLDLLLACDACHSGKIQKARRPKKSTSRATVFGHTIRTDSTSRQPIRTFGHKRYANVAVDEASRWSFVTLLRTLKHTTERAMKPLLKTDLKGLTKILGSDQGSEFMNAELQALLGPDHLGIKHQSACADDQSQNGLAERTIGVLFAMVRTLIADSKLPLNFWGELLITANYLRNRLPTSANPGSASPYEIRYGKKPNLRNLRPIGVRCTVLKHSRKINGMKAKSRGLKGILVGYGEPFGLKGWRVYIPDVNKIVTAPNVLFLEDMEQSLNARPPDLLLANDVSTLNPFHEQPTNGNATAGGNKDMPDSDDNDPTVIQNEFDQSRKPANQDLASTSPLPNQSIGTSSKAHQDGDQSEGHDSQNSAADSQLPNQRIGTSSKAHQDGDQSEGHANQETGTSSDFGLAVETETEHPRGHDVEGDSNDSELKATPRPSSCTPRPRLQPTLDQATSTTTQTTRSFASLVCLQLTKRNCQTDHQQQEQGADERNTTAPTSTPCRIFSTSSKPTHTSTWPKTPSQQTSTCPLHTQTHWPVHAPGNGKKPYRQRSTHYNAWGYTKS
jgi:hypothetical protein